MKKKLIHVTLFSSVVNIFLSGIKIVIGYSASSQALLADGFHSLSDLLSDVVVFFGVLFGSKPEDSSHHYGHKKIENFAELFLGCLLFLSAVYIGYDSILELMFGNLNEIDNIVFWGAGLSLVLKEIMFWVTLRTGNKCHSDAVIANAWHHRTDAFSSAAVIVGLIAGKIIPGGEIADPLIGILIAFSICYMASKILWKAFGKLIDTAPSYLIRRNIYSVINKNPEVLDTHNLKMRYVGNQIYIETHIMVNPEYSLRKAHDIATLIKKDIIKANEDIYDVTIHVEPYE